MNTLSCIHYTHIFVIVVDFAGFRLFCRATPRSRIRKRILAQGPVKLHHEERGIRAPPTAGWRRSLVRAARRLRREQLRLLAQAILALVLAG